MAVNAYLIKLQKQKAKEISLNRKLMMQFCADAAIMAANDIFQRKGEKLVEFHNKFCEYAEGIAALVIEDARADEEIVYTKAKVDSRLHDLLGDKFQPWEERYDAIFEGVSR